MGKEKKTLYIETTIPSYATARDSRDVVYLADQLVTRAFWEDERRRFQLCTSEAVHLECSRGDPDAAQRRSELLAGITNFPVTSEDRELAAVYQRLLDIPERAKADCTHLAVCVRRRIDYLLTWNCTHLGPVAHTKARAYNEKHGLWTPELETPRTMMEIIARGNL
ncbi:MAG: type II toxin-antitoxin system VapC family toxin [Treponema sp.]|jgi:hypothetical protein|nr:type II toxin-antitoxin system VapC family toxin [Treponema sp.]